MVAILSDNEPLLQEQRRRFIWLQVKIIDFLFVHLIHNLLFLLNTEDIVINHLNNLSEEEQLHPFYTSCPVF